MSAVRLSNVRAIFARETLAFIARAASQADGTAS